jgi:hypothetical protein
MFVVVVVVVGVLSSVVAMTGSLGGCECAVSATGPNCPPCRVVST